MREADVDQQHPNPDSAWNASTRSARWSALSAALLGWMFDGLEMGLFPLVARPALRDLLPLADEPTIGRWIAVITATFLIGAATGGVLFGWLGDRIGRVRAMALSILIYSLFSGFCALAREPWQIAGLRFISALGMGGEWSLGVALVMEVWPDRSRALLAGLIGAVANFGYLLIGLLGFGLSRFLAEAAGRLQAIGLSEAWAAFLVSHSGWRLLMLAGTLPALLTFFIRVLVPESARWREEQKGGGTSHWAVRDLLGVGVGALGALGIVYLWAAERPFSISENSAAAVWEVRVLGTLAALAVVVAGYTYPVYRYLQRARADGVDSLRPNKMLARMLLAACLGGVPLLGTWASIQLAPAWADQLAGEQFPEARAFTQISSASGAIVGCLAAAFLGNWLGRRASYQLLCIGSLAAALGFFQLNHAYGVQFLIWVGIAGAFTASFYGWLPLYLPELFPTRLRATGQGFGFNFGRILAAVGVLQTGNLMSVFGGSYPKAFSVMSLIYLVGMGIIWLAPETHGRPLPN